MSVTTETPGANTPELIAAIADTPFDISPYIGDLRGSPYLEVKWRLVWLEKTCPYYSIYTRAETISDQIAVFTATVTIFDSPKVGADDQWEGNPVKRSASAHGSETPTDFRDYIEKAETKAIGRALAMLGFGTQFAPEMGGELEGGNPRPVDAPASVVGRGPGAFQTQRTPLGAANPMRQGNWNRTGGSTAGGWGNGGGGGMQNPDGPPSDKQKDFLWRLGQQIFGDDEAGDALDDLANTFGAANLMAVTKQQASEMIERLKGMKDQ